MQRQEGGCDIFYSVVGLHAITLPQDPKTLRRERREMMAALLACGVDPNRATLFHQDQVGQLKPGTFYVCACLAHTS